MTILIHKPYLVKVTTKGEGGSKIPRGLWMTPYKQNSKPYVKNVVCCCCVLLRQLHWESSLETEFEELSGATKTRFIAIQPILCTLVIITKNRPQQPNSTHTMQNANMTCVAYCLIKVSFSCLIFITICMYCI